MRFFRKRITLFIAPILLAYVLPMFILWQSREYFFEVDKVLTSNKKYLIGYAYNASNDFYLKWASITLNPKRDVWALGSSRVLSFRENMFDSTFYNAGGTISSLNDFRPFLRSIPKSKYPKYLILGLDHWMFNQAWDHLNTIHSVERWKTKSTLYPTLATNLKVYKSVFLGKIDVNSFKNDKMLNRIGLSALVKNSGYKNDGSYFYGDQIFKLMNNDSTANDYEYWNTYKRIENGDMRFEFAESVNDKAIIELNELLLFCKKNKIQVIGILSPFADKVYKRMSDSGNFRYLDSIYNRAKPIFDRFGFEFYDFSTVSSCNSSDNETIDGFHGGEKTYQRLLIKILEEGSILNKVAKQGKLIDDLHKSTNDFIVYEN